jgi:hypothetical protein
MTVEQKRGFEFAAAVAVTLRLARMGASDEQNLSTSTVYAIAAKGRSK